MKKLLEKLNLINPEILERCEYACFDRGYDDEDLIKKLFDYYGVKPIIDIRNMWKDKEQDFWVTQEILCMIIKLQLVATA